MQAPRLPSHGEAGNSFEQEIGLHAQTHLSRLYRQYVHLGQKLSELSKQKPVTLSDINRVYRQEYGNTPHENFIQDNATISHFLRYYPNKITQEEMKDIAVKLAGQTVDENPVSQEIKTIHSATREDAADISEWLIDAVNQDEQ